MVYGWITVEIEFVTEENNWIDEHYGRLALTIENIIVRLWRQKEKIYANKCKFFG